MLNIPYELFTLIKQHGERSFPEECLGLLLGKCNADTRLVHSLIPVKNSATSRRTEFALSETDLLKAEKIAARQNLDVIGIYHSHADFDAVASKKDRDFAFPFLSYPIVSVLDGKAVAVKSFAFIGGTKKTDFSHQLKKSAYLCTRFVHADMA